MGRDKGVGPNGEAGPGPAGCAHGNPFVRASRWAHMRGWSTAKRTKIVCTIGPASADPDVLRALIRGGMDVARLNFSHGTREEHGRLAGRIRGLSEELGRPVAVLGDLEGPRIRVGEMAEGTVLATDSVVLLTPEDRTGDSAVVPISHPRLAADVAPGDAILLADGTLELEVEAREGVDLRCRVLVGGPLPSNKGVNVPLRALSLPPLTAKDEEDLRFAVRNEFDFVGQSFVDRAASVQAARTVTEEAGRVLPIVAKVERQEAVERLEEILRAADGVMVARGDLGVEIPLERVPSIQKRIIGAGRRLGKPVITATQMLQSMVESPRPTRAEATDVYNAILDGTDAIMLSEETAVGRHPVEAVRVLSAIAREADGVLAEETEHPHREKEAVAGAVAGATVDTARSLQASAIVAPTSSGRTPRAIARYRPSQPILALCSDRGVLRTLCLTWGVVPLPFPGPMTVDTVIDESRRLAAAEGLPPDRPLVVAMGYPPRKGLTNMVLVPELPEGKASDPDPEGSSEAAA